MTKIPWDDEVESALDWAKCSSTSTEALPHLRKAADILDGLINENMSAVLLHENGTLNNVARLAGFTENAVGPRLARSNSLSAYARPDGRVTASGITRAVYDAESSNPPIDQPMKFVARKPRKEV